MLDHPNLVGVSDFGIHKGKPYIVMDLVQGQSLSDVLDHRARLSSSEVIDLCLQVCDGLTYAHDRGVIHRDLKPSNIMLVWHNDGSYTARIVDFGLAKIVHSDMRLTSTGDVMGSPLYMSPEQCMGNRLDHRSDIYSLGCLLYECLSGEPPFSDAESVLEMFRRHALEQPAPLNPALSVPDWLSQLVFTALAKSPDDRFQTVSELKVCLSEKGAVIPRKSVAPSESTIASVLAPQDAVNKTWSQ
jgi:serine/threonine-protein kinase